jgi:DNA-binding winged helix-turn-helix (wHTH) protein
MPNQSLFQRLKFGIFEADLRTGELSKHGLRIRLPRQSFQVLTILLEAPGEIVSREHLQLKLWKGETFVEFDRAINKAVARIRQSLGDTPNNPRFVETVSGRGYRFIAPVTDAGAFHQSRELHFVNVLRSSLLPPSNTSFLPNHFAISADGRRLAFVATNTHGNESIWIRDLASVRAKQSIALLARIRAGQRRFSILCKSGWPTGRVVQRTLRRVAQLQRGYARVS